MAVTQPGSPPHSTMWAASSLRSTFGTQCLATHESAPACGFGSGLREAGGKTYISADADRALCRAQGGNNSQGPIYRVLDALGKQCLSTRASSPMSGFGSAKRPGIADYTISPGPGAYRLSPTIGDQVESTKASAATVHFPGATRDAAEKIFISQEHEKSGYGRDSPGPSAYNVGGRGLWAHSAHSTLKGAERFKDLGAKTRAGFPGPGQYTLPVGVGKQAVSTRRSTRAVGFSTADRDASSKIFISTDHEKSNYGVGTPGPGTANPPKGIGRPELSTNSKPPSWGFGTGTSSPYVTNGNPGPGEYYA